MCLGFRCPKFEQSMRRGTEHNHSTPKNKNMFDYRLFEFSCSKTVSGVFEFVFLFVAPYFDGEVQFRYLDYRL